MRSLRYNRSCDISWLKREKGTPRALLFGGVKGLTGDGKGDEFSLLCSKPSSLRRRNACHLSMPCIVRRVLCIHCFLPAISVLTISLLQKQLSILLKRVPRGYFEYFIIIKLGKLHKFCEHKTKLLLS